MFNEYDLAVMQSNIAFEKACNEFELFNGLAYLTESEEDKKEKSLKSGGAFKNIIASIMKVFNSLREKIGSLIDKFKGESIDKDAKISVKEDPKNKAKRCEEMRKSGFSIIDKIKKAKSKEEIDKEMDQWSSKSKKIKNAAGTVGKAVAVTAGAVFTAYTAMQTSLRLSYKEAAKHLPDTGIKSIDDLTNKKQSAIVSVLKTLKGVLMDEVSEVGKYITGGNVENLMSVSGHVRSTASHDKEYDAARLKNARKYEKEENKYYKDYAKAGLKMTVPNGTRISKADKYIHSKDMENALNNASKTFDKGLNDTKLWR